MKHSLIETAKAEIRAASEPTSHSIKSAANALASEGAKVAELARHWADQGGAAGQQAAAAVRREAQALNERTHSYVQAQPTRSLLLAAAVGAAITGLALLLSRRS